MLSRKPRVALVFGGRSTEHAISCVSAGSVLTVLDRSAYDVVAVGISPEGRWVLAADDAEALAIRGGVLPGVDGTSGPALALPGDPTAGGLVVHEPGELPRALGQVDVVFPLLHGPYGEDGTLQGLLELAGVPYVGSGVLASAVGMDKAYMKLLLEAAGLPGGRYEVIRPREWATDRPAVLARLERLGLPVFVKPARGGSSVGISRVTRADGLREAIEEARRHDPKVIVEAAIVGREIECGVLEGENGAPPEASVPGEIGVRGAHEFYDFEAKYLDDVTELTIPADLPPEVTRCVQETACRAFDALSCEGLLRVDFFVREDGSVVLNEVNTMPGFTPVSMFPRLWDASGLDYPALVDRLIRTALARGAGLR